MPFLPLLSSGGDKQIDVVKEHLSHFDSPMVASKGVVSGSSRSVCGTSVSASFSSGSIATTSFSSVSSSAPRASASRLATVERFAKEVGVSRAVARQLAHCHRTSSQRLYQHRWKSYR